MRERLRRAGPLLAFAGLCYLPLLATSPGQVVADTKSYLYLDPDRMLSRAWSIWDAHVGLGTVTHQYIGFLWPMGPYYWLMEHLGLPDWVAQRLWLGSIMFVAGLGMRYLLRTFGWRGSAVAVAMCAYGLTPYILTISVRISALLLPFVALPWMIALAARALRTGSWRHPAAFALVVATVGTSNATAIILAGVGPILWLVWEAATRHAPLPRVAAVVGRIGVLSLATNAWWIVGLSVQATNGIDVLRYTESVETTAAASSAQEVLRGLGYWFFYGDDPIGPWVGPSRPYQSSVWLLAATFAVPILAVAAGAVARWRERSFFVLLAVVGLTLAVGVYPYDDPSPFGRALKGFLESDVGMAMRSMPRAAPLVVLSLAVMLGGGVHALSGRVPRAALPAAAAVIGLVVLSLAPLWQRTLAPENVRRPEEIPRYWIEAGQHLDATDDGTRVLELPGTDFTSYRWGTTFDPVTPGLTDRPLVARELQPMGVPAAWNLLKAFDGRLQARTAERTSVAPIARTMRAGQILLRSDLQYEHYDTPRPRDLWDFILGVPGLAAPTEFGSPEPNVAQDPAPMLDELELGLDPTLRDPFPVSVLPVESPVPVVTAKPTGVPVVIAGDGEGVVDSAAAGLIDGTELLRYSAALTDAELDQALDDGAVLIVTDGNRRRAERWGTIRFTSGYTEPAGLEPLAIDRSDARLPVFPDADDDARTIAVHRGGITANATSYGGRNEYLPEDRPANAVDGDPTTSWRAARDDPVRGERLVLRTDRPVTTDTLAFLAPPPPINRWITQVALRFDGGPPLLVDLDERSRSGTGQAVDVGARTFTTVDIEVVADTAGPQGRYGGLTSTGFAEVRVGDLRLDELVRPPVDLLDRAGSASASHPLAIVLTRLRSAPTDIERLDEERTLARAIDLPSPRGFSFSGTARLSARASDSLLDVILQAPGAPAGPVATASSRLAGTRARASAAIDGDRDTAWVSAYGEQVGQWLDVGGDAMRSIDRLDLVLVADGRHSVPTRLALEVDGRQAATLDLPTVSDQDQPGATTRVTVPLPEPVSGSTFRVTVEDVRAIETQDWSTRKIRTLPVGIAELGIQGIQRPAPTGAFRSGCRSELLTVDGEPVPVEVSGTVEAALDGDPLALSTCDGADVTLSAGSHDLRSAPGATTGLDVDRVVLRSSADGTASPDPSIPLAAEADADEVTAAPSTTIVQEGAASLSVRIDGAEPGQPFWLAFGQGQNSGWEATIDGVDLGPSVLVDGFANGWRIEPDQRSFVVSLRFAPQQRVTIALWASLIASLACLALVVRGAVAARRTGTGDGVVAGSMPEPLTLASVSAAGPPLRAAPAVAVTVAMVGLAALVSTPAVALLVGLLTATAAVGVVPRWLTAAAAPAAMGASAAYVVLTVLRHSTLPGLEWPSELARAHPIAWLAVLALAADATVVALRGRTRR